MKGSGNEIDHSAECYDSADLHTWLKLLINALNNIGLGAESEIEIEAEANGNSSSKEFDKKNSVSIQNTDYTNTDNTNSSNIPSASSSTSFTSSSSSSHISQLFEPVRSKGEQRCNVQYSTMNCNVHYNTVL